MVPVYRRTAVIIYIESYEHLGHRNGISRVFVVSTPEICSYGGALTMDSGTSCARQLFPNLARVADALKGALRPFITAIGLYCPVVRSSWMARGRDRS